MRFYGSGEATVYEREKLYEEVWAEPVSVVARRYGVSDVAIHKTCKRLSVPVPPRGYWARLRAGQRVERPPLPATKGATRAYGPPRKPDPEPADDEGEKPGPLAFLSEEERARVLDACESIRIKDRLVKPHPLITQDREARQELNRRQREARRSPSSLSYDYDYESLPATKPVTGLLDLRVADDQLPRAYRLLDALFCTVEALGGKVNAGEHTTAVILGESVEFRLIGKVDQLAFIITEYRAPRKNWRDTKRKQLEDELGSITIGLFECAHILRTAREEREREEERRRVQAQQRRERAIVQRKEMARYTALENAAMDWHKARVLEGFVAELERRALGETDANRQSALMERVTWARAKIAWLDPLLAAEDPVLGRRRHDKPDDEKVVLEEPDPRDWMLYEDDLEEDEE